MADHTLDLGALQSLLDRVSGLKVACVGDLMLDRYVYGEVTRVSPEGPIPVLKTRRTVSMPGGVGNVARNVAALGGKARLGAVAGQDAAGDALAELIAAEDGVADFIARPDGAATIVKTRFVAAGQQLLRQDDETESHAIFDRNDVFSDASVILLSDYAKGVVSDAVIQSALRVGLPVVVDPKGRDFPLRRG